MMRLETAKRIAHIKELVRQQSQLGLAEAVAVTERENRKLDDLLRLRQQYVQALEDMLHDGRLLPAGWWLQWEQFQQRLEEDIRRQRRQVDQAKRQEEHRRQEVLARSVDENRWNKIRQMIYVQRVAEMQKQEQKELDDLAGMRHVYRR